MIKEIDTKINFRHPKLVLGIETSCDETAVAIVDTSKKVYSHILSSQIKTHERYGGVVPELAARAHLEKLMFLVEEAFQQAKIKPTELNAIAATSGPGLIGGVIVGMMFAKGMSQSLQKPFIAINHLEAHALVARLNCDVSFPYLLLLASGGHCQFLLVKDIGDFELLGQTIDDAAGEAFDKVAKMLGLPYPGGPAIENLAKEGNPNRYDLPKPMLGRAGCHLSFSGLKTAVKNLIDKEGESLNHADLAASFQKTVSDCLVNRASHAIATARQKQPCHTFVLAGGVAANQEIRKHFEGFCFQHSLSFVAPPLPLCTDNAIMIAWAGVERLKRGLIDDLSIEARPRWPLEELKKND